MAQTWNRGSAFVALIAQGVLAFGILLSAAIDIGFAREAIKEENDDYSYNYDDYYYTSYEYSTGPSEYPYGYGLLLPFFLSANVRFQANRPVASRFY